MKKKYSDVEFEVFMFETEDVITDSNSSTAGNASEAGGGGTGSGEIDPDE
ncbi:MAG: hypothetical protein IJ806_02415 [Ruminococcus sp.]|nr:hypothetical protein [Ruminococcus sp.]